MDYEKPENQFQEVHRKVRQRLERDLKTNDNDAEARKQGEEMPIASFLTASLLTGCTHENAQTHAHSL